MAARPKRGSERVSLLEGLEQHTSKLWILRPPLYDPGLRRNLGQFCLSASPALADKQAAESVLLFRAKGHVDFPALIHSTYRKVPAQIPVQNVHHTQSVDYAWLRGLPNSPSLFATGHLDRGDRAALVRWHPTSRRQTGCEVKSRRPRARKIDHHLDSFFDLVWPSH